MSHQSYGVTEQSSGQHELHESLEEIKRYGYTILDSRLSEARLDLIEKKIERCLATYEERHTLAFLESIDEHNTIRAPFLLDPVFLEICFNERLMDLISLVMGDNFIVNQQNVVINPSRERYSQSLWHRDLPYQHFTSSRPLAINALFCINDFTLSNGCTRLLPSSHLFESFPSERFIEKNQRPVEAVRGSFLVLDSMTYHSGSQNNSEADRIGVNNVFSIPLIKRQIEISEKDFYYDISRLNKSNFQKLVSFPTPKSVSAFLDQRVAR